MIKPITFDSHYVTYKVINKNDRVLENRIHEACFENLFRLEFDSNFKINLSDFLRIETSEYAIPYIEMISDICDVKTTFISPNNVEVTGFKNKFLLKMFLTLYRILFESNRGYGYILSDVIKKRIQFFNALLNKNVDCEYRCNLKKLIHFHNLYITNSLGNSNHCLRLDTKLKLKSKADLLIYKRDESVHNFFIY